MERKNNIILNNMKMVQKEKEMYKMKKIINKEEVKKMVCKAIDNIPDCAGVIDCYTEHSFMGEKAYIKIVVAVLDEDNEKQIVEFHNIAHDGFESGMDAIS